VLARNARALAAAVPAIDRYLDRVGTGIERTDPDAIDRLVLDIWLLGRFRLLHVAWLATVRELVPPCLLAEARDWADGWLRLASESYVGMRRAQRGVALPPSVLRRLGVLLRDEVDLAGRLAAATADRTPPAEILDVVTVAMREVLKLDDDRFDPARPLRSLPNFNSFRLVDIIERAEERFGVSLDAEDLTLDSLHDADSLARLFARAVSAANQDATGTVQATEPSR
jgi:hypothetical protein